MATIDSLAARLPSDLEALIMDPAAVQQYENDLFNRARGDIETSAGNEAQRLREKDFGRGFGLSSLNAYAQGQVDKARAEALSRARMDAFTNTQAAQRAALGQAAAHVNAQQARQQAGSQFDRNLKQQKSIATQNMVMGGLAGLGGAAMKTAGNIWGDDIKKKLGGLFNSTGGDSASPAFPGASPADFPGSQDAAMGGEFNPAAIAYEPGGSGIVDEGPESLSMEGYLPQNYDFNGGGGLGDLMFDMSDWDFGGDWGNTDLSALVGNDWSW